MMKIKRQEFAFENEFVKIVNPNKDQEKEISLILKKYAKENNSEIKLTYHILNKLCIAKDTRYDFSQYSLNEFSKMFKEKHFYVGLEEIINAIKLISSNITIHELQYIALGLKHQRIQLLMSIIEDETDALNSLGKEIYYEKKEIEKMASLKDVYREKRNIRKEVESLVGEME